MDHFGTSPAMVQAILDACKTKGDRKQAIWLLARSSRTPLPTPSSSPSPPASSSNTLCCILGTAHEVHCLLDAKIGNPHHNLAQAIAAAKPGLPRSINDRLRQLCLSANALRHTTPAACAKLLRDIHLSLCSDDSFQERAAFDNKGYDASAVNDTIPGLLHSQPEQAPQTAPRHDGDFSHDAIQALAARIEVRFEVLSRRVDLLEAAAACAAEVPHQAPIQSAEHTQASALPVLAESRVSHTAALPSCPVPSTIPLAWLAYLSLRLLLLCPGLEDTSPLLFLSRHCLA